MALDSSGSVTGRSLSPDEQTRGGLGPCVSGGAVVLLAPHCLLLFFYFLLILSSTFRHSYPVLFPFVPLCAVRAMCGGRFWKVLRTGKVTLTVTRLERWRAGKNIVTRNCAILNIL